MAALRVTVCLAKKRQFWKKTEEYVKKIYKEAVVYIAY